MSLDVPAPAVLAELDVGRGTQLWLVDRLGRDAVTHRPVRFSSAWMRVDAVRLVLETGRCPDGLAGASTHNPYARTVTERGGAS